MERSTFMVDRRGLPITKRYGAVDLYGRPPRPTHHKKIWSGRPLWSTAATYPSQKDMERSTFMVDRRDLSITKRYGAVDLYGRPPRPIDHKKIWSGRPLWSTAAAYHHKKIWSGRPLWSTAATYPSQKDME